MMELKTKQMELNILTTNLMKIIVWIIRLLMCLLIGLIFILGFVFLVPIFLMLVVFWLVKDVLEDKIRDKDLGL